MKHLLLTTITAVVLVGCGESTVKSVDEISVDEILKGNIEGVKQYLAAGAVVNEWVWIRAHGTSQLPLSLAVQEGHKEIFELIIAKGTDVNAKGGIGGGTPLHRAATKEIVELLITKGADVNARDDVGKTPLDWANDELADLLRKHGGKTGEELKAEGK
jgi:cytohesin